MSVIVSTVRVTSYSLFLSLYFQRQSKTLVALSKVEIFETKAKGWELTIAIKNSIFDIAGVLDPPSVTLAQNVFTKRHEHRAIVSILTSNMEMFVEQ